MPSIAHKISSPDQWAEKHVIYQSANVRLEYNGPRPAPVNQVVVAFPPFDYPFDEKLEGWGARSFKKRGMANVCVFHKNENWHQYQDFFDALAACREFFGPNTEITTYGFSMGGLAALLGARALDAKRAVAVAPQFSIKHELAPFEKRFAKQRNTMGSWMHGLHEAMDNNREYLVIYDPLQGLDRRQVALLPKPSGYQPCLMHGANHLCLKAITQMGIQENFFNLLRGQENCREMRHAYRANRRVGFRYLRKVGSILHAKNHPMAPYFLSLAEQNGMGRLIKKWNPYHKGQKGSLE